MAYRTDRPDRTYPERQVLGIGPLRGGNLMLVIGLR